METGKYAYVAHPDLIHYIGSDEIYERHMLRLCQYLKAHDIPVEINLLGVVEHRHYTSGRFLRIAQKAGNSAIIGCDAHTPDRLSNVAYIQNCLDLAKCMTYRWWTFCRISWQKRKISTQQEKALTFPAKCAILRIF